MHWYLHLGRNNESERRRRGRIHLPNRTLVPAICHIIRGAFGITRVRIFHLHRCVRGGDTDASVLESPDESSLYDDPTVLTTPELQIFGQSQWNQAQASRPFVRPGQTCGAAYSEKSHYRVRLGFGGGFLIFPSDCVSPTPVSGPKAIWLCLDR